MYNGTSTLAGDYKRERIKGNNVPNYLNEQEDSSILIVPYLPTIRLIDPRQDQDQTTSICLLPFFNRNWRHYLLARIQENEKETVEILSLWQRWDFTRVLGRSPATSNNVSALHPLSTLSPPVKPQIGVQKGAGIERAEQDKKEGRGRGSSGFISTEVIGFQRDN